MGFKDFVFSDYVSAKELLIPEIVPHIHPCFYDKFRKNMKLNHSVQNKVIYVSRTHSDTHKNERLVVNQNAVIAALSKRYGQDLVVFKSEQLSFQQALELFQKAKFVIGIHGGAMYNAFYSAPGIKVLELMPISASGLYYSQDSFTQKPVFAHLAMYTNTILLRQQFYRYYQLSLSSSCRVDIKKFIEFLLDVLILEFELTVITTSIFCGFGIRSIRIA